MSKINIPVDEFITYVKLLNTSIETIVEVGALDAGDSLNFKNHFPEANVYAIEGLKDNYEKYMKNLTNIKTFCTAISDEDGKEVDYFVKDINGIHGLLNRGQQFGIKTQKVVTKTLKTFCLEQSITQIDVLKIDVEGLSYQVLKGMGDMIGKVKFLHIETETYPFFENQILEEEVFKLLESSGLEMVDKGSCEITPNAYQTDSIWVNKKIF